MREINADALGFPFRRPTSNIIRTQHTASTTQSSQTRSALQDRSTVGIIETSPSQDSPAPRFASQIRSPSSLPGSSDSQNPSTKPPHSFGKLLSRTNRALVPQAKLKLTSSKLVQAISTAPPKLEAIELLLKKGADPNICTDEGESALKLATSKDQYSIVQVLLKYGADSMKLDANGSSPIEEAFSRGNAQIVLILLQNAARLDFGFGRFGTCIQAAARGGNVELCTLVVDRGLDTYLSGSGLYGNALQAGVVSRNAKVVEFLLGHGADVNVKGGCYGTSLRAAAEIEDIEICQLLASKGADVNLATDACETALLSAVTKENLEVSKLLLNAGATITSRIMKVAWESKKKWDLLRLLGQHGGSVDDISVPYFGTALQSYASRSEVDKCKRLLENCNVNVNANQGHYATALQAAVNSRSREVVGLLLDHGADPNVEGGEFGTALHAAVACNRVDLCGMLIDAGANLNMKSNRDTALNSAVKNKHSGVARLLLENGADSTEVDADERPALHLAAISGQEGLVKLLLDKQGGKNDFGTDEALRLAAMNGHDRVMIVLLEHRADSAAPDANGRTSLHLAAFHGHESSAKLLLDNGGDINWKDSNGDGPLSLAAANGHRAVTKLLLRHSAYLDYSSGVAVLRMAIRMKDLPLVEFLIERGVNVNSTDLDGQTILQLALLKGSGDIVRLLREHGAMTTVDAHFERPFRGVMPEEAWTYTINPTAGWD